MADDASRPFDKPRFQAVDPSTGAPGRAYDGHTVEEARAIVAAARQAQQAWRRTGFAERSRLMKQAAAVMRGRSDDLCELMTAEMGKT